MSRKMDYAQIRYLSLTEGKPRLYVHRGWKEACLSEMGMLSGMDEADVIEAEEIEAGANTIGVDDSALHGIRFNPFLCPQGYMPAAHIENLSALLERCFDLTRDMAWILRAAIRRAYIRCDWDLSKPYAGAEEMRVPTFFDLMAVLSGDEGGICAGLRKDAAQEMMLRLNMLTQDLAERIFLSGTETDREILQRGGWIAMEHIWPSELRAVLTAALLLRMKEERLCRTAAFPEKEERAKKAVSHVIGEIYRAKDTLPDRQDIGAILDRGEVPCAAKEEVLAQYDLLCEGMKRSGQMTRKDRAAFVIRVCGCYGIAERMPLSLSGQKPEEAYKQYLRWKERAALEIEAHICPGMPNRAARIAADLVVYMAQIAQDSRYKKILDILKTYEDSYFRMPQDDVPLR